MSTCITDNNVWLLWSDEHRGLWSGEVWTDGSEDIKAATFTTEQTLLPPGPNARWVTALQAAMLIASLTCPNCAARMNADDTCPTCPHRMRSEDCDCAYCQQCWAAALAERN